MRDVGKAKGAENHQKHSYRMIRGLARPLGWSARELELAAVVARYHRGALPRPRGKSMQTLELADRRIAMELAGVLRLANALDMRNGRESANAPRLEVSVQDRFGTGAGGGILGAGPFGGRNCRGAAFAGDGAAAAGAGAGLAGFGGKAQSPAAAKSDAGNEPAIGAMKSVCMRTRPSLRDLNRRGDFPSAEALG